MKRGTLIALFGLGLAAATIKSESRASDQSLSHADTPVDQPAAPGFEELCRRATEAREAGRLQEAVALYEEALRQRPSWDEGFWYLGTLHYDAGRFGPASVAFRRAVALRPRAGPAWVMLGLCEFQLGAYRQAFVDIDQGKSVGGLNTPIKAAADYHLGIIYTKFEQYEAAVEVLRKLAEFNPATPTLLQALGTAILRMPFLPKELPEEKRALVTEAGEAGYAHAHKRWDDAVRRFRGIVERYPEMPNVHYAYGAFLHATDAEAALREFRREIEVSPDHAPARLKIALEHMRRGEGQTGLPYAEEAVRLAPELPPARYILGRLLLTTGDDERAVSELERAARLDPDNPQVRFSLSQAYRRVGRSDDARRAHEKFVELEKEQRSRMDRLPTDAFSVPGTSEAPPSQ
jgi:tetratricopeptide (TPR) repeat protein